MGTTSEKLTYLNTTKQALKESINNIGGDITSETTFREYAQELDNIYDNLPKTTGESSNLSLTTLKGKMNIIPKGDTEQYSTNGYQLIPYTLEILKTINTDGTWNGNSYVKNGITYKVNEDLSITANGTGTSADTNFYLVGRGNETTQLPSGNYTIALKGRAKDKIGIYLDGSDGSTSSRVTQIGATENTDVQSKTFSLASTTAMYRVWLWIGNGTTISNMTVYPMIESGTTAHDYEPYTNGASPNPTYPQNIEVVTGTQEVKVSGNEFAEIETQTLNDMKITKTDNGYILNGTASANTTFRATITNPTNSNKTLCVKCDTAITNANIQVKTRSSNAAQLRSISLGNANTWVVSSGTFEDYYCDIYVKSGTTLSNVLVQPMLLEGTFTTSNLGKYQPYNEEQTQTISLGDIELCKIGNYQDYLYKSGDKWYKKAYEKKLAITSQTTIFYEATLDNVSRFRITLQDSNGANTTGNAYCNCLICKDGYTLDTPHFYIYKVSSTTQNVYLFIPNSIASNLSQLQTWLGTHTFELYYPLQTETDIEITNTNLIEQLDNLEKLKSYNGVTNINCSGNLSAILSVSAIKGE